jgi:hypothetical protein
MFEGRWYRLLHYLRNGLAKAGQDGALLEADARSRLVRIPIPGTSLWWDCVVEEEDVLLGDLTMEANFLLTTYHIACEKAERKAARV